MNPRALPLFSTQNLKWKKVALQKKGSEKLHSLGRKKKGAAFIVQFLCSEEYV